MQKEEVLEIARRAKAAGVTRVCMGAAWREVRDNKQFDRVLDMVKDVTELGVEVCCTLGMLSDDQAQKLDDAGLYAYNHNLDTSERFYDTIISTRTFADRLNTIASVRKTNVTVCTGGIIGLGETVDDRLSMLQTLSQMQPHPESVHLTMEALRIPSDQVVVIGDSTFDLDMARSAGVDAIGVTTGIHTRELLQKSAPRHIVNGLHEVTPLILNGRLR